MRNQYHWREHRLMLGITQAELGVAVGVTQPMLSRYERGYTTVPGWVSKAALTFMKEAAAAEDYHGELSDTESQD